MKSARLAALAFAAVAPAWAQLGGDEHACQQAASKQSGALVGKRIKCLVACDKQALKGKAPAIDCLPPFGGTTLACVDTARTKALDGIAKRCARLPGVLRGRRLRDVRRPTLIADVRAGEIDVVAPFVRCDDGASPDGLTTTRGEGPPEGRARRRQSSCASSEKCVAKCRKAEAAGKVPAGACVHLVGSDPKTIECLIKVGDKALDLLADPELRRAGMPGARHSTFALPIAQGIIQDFDPRIFCGSPSGAFVE